MLSARSVASSPAGPVAPGTMMRWSILSYVVVMLAAGGAVAAERTVALDKPLQAAVAAAAAGDVLVLAPGVHAGLVTIDRAITLRGAPGAVIVGAGKGSVVTVESPDARIEGLRSEEHTSELQSLMRTSYAVFCLTKK